MNRILGIRFTAKKRLGIYIGAAIWIISIIDLFSDVMPGILGYADEGFALLCLVFLVYKIIAKGKMKKSLLLIVLVAMIGLVGNVICGIQSNMYIVMLDVFLFAKPYIIFFSIYSFIEETCAESSYRFLTVVSKWMLIAMAAFSVIARFVNLGMYLPNGAFCMLSGFGGFVGNWTMLFFAIIYSDQRNKRLFYYILSLIIIIQSQSGLAMLSMLLVVIIYLFIEKQRRFRWYYMIPIIPICILAGRNEITDYFMNINAPRYLMFYYAFITANRFFPIGSGFATYGSTMAASVYSKLYTEYGFNHRYGMTQEDTRYLMDSYYPQIIGQSGYIGTAIYVLYLYFLLKKVILKIGDKNVFCACLWIFVCWVISGFGFTSGVWGGAVYAVIAIFALIKNNREMYAGEAGIPAGTYEE